MRDGRLVIYGNGSMQFVARSATPAPWSKYADQITSIVVETGVASIANKAFSSCSNVTTVTVADTVTSIGSAAFAGCESLTDVTFTGDAPTIAENSFQDVDVKIHYPEDNTTWNEAVGQDFGGDVTWNTYVIKTTPMYRLYNPNADCGSHHYTNSIEERGFLVSVGWIFEDIGWFGMLK